MTRLLCEIITCDGEDCRINRMAVGKTKPLRDKQIKEWRWKIDGKKTFCPVCKK